MTKYAENGVTSLVPGKRVLFSVNGKWYSGIIKQEERELLIQPTDKRLELDLLEIEGSVYEIPKSALESQVLSQRGLARLLYFSPIMRKAIEPKKYFDVYAPKSEVIDHIVRSYPIIIHNFREDYALEEEFTTSPFAQLKDITL